jgi:class 3 adenylate cyclase/tetratricopeptide (TPR) repeat protein
MPPGARTFVFGEFELDEARFELRRAGRPVELRATPFRLLQHLIRERARVVSKDELIEAVWPDVAVSDMALSSALKAVRHALGDDGKEQRWIQTLRGRGIRFLGLVEQGHASTALAASAPVSPPRRAEASITTILFADLVASTERLQALGDERAQRLFEALHERMTRVVEAHAGEELQWLGDGVMAAFGSAADAVRAAIALQHVTRQGIEGERLGLRAGLNVGEVLRSERRDPGSGHFGLPVIVASRLCDRARAGEILASSVVAGLLVGRRAFRFREVGTVELKGVEAPVQACAVEYEAEASGVALVGGTPFVGRARELARLEAALERAEAGEGAVAFVTGEPGIGKTRILTELAAQARARGARVLAGRCFEGEGARPYAPFAEALDGYVGEADRAEILADLGPYGSEIGAIAPRLRTRLPELPELPRLGGEEDRTRLFYAVSELLLAASKRAPLVLVLDDLHWADGATVALLRYLGRLVAKGRLLILGGYRDGEVGREHPLAIALAAMKREVEYERIALAGLAPDQVGRLLEALAQHEVGTPFADFMTAETAGNPFFLREFLLHMVEAGELRREEGSWTARLPLEELGLPEGVRQVVGRRLARLSPAANRLLAAAAACQGGFSFEVARSVVDLREAEALDALDEALDAQIVRAAGGGGDGYEFHHDLIRHTLYAVPSPSRRARLHRRIAEEMERVFGAAAGERAAEIARQYHESRALPGAERGATYALVAADLAERAAAQEEVARWLRLALDLLPAQDARRPRILARLALALAWSFQGKEAADRGLEAADLLVGSEGSDAAADSLCDLSRVLTVYDWPLASRLAERGMTLLGDRRDLVWCRFAAQEERRRQAEDPSHPGLPLDTPIRREITRIVLAARVDGATLHRLALVENLALDCRQRALELGTPITVAHLGGDLRRGAFLYRESAECFLARGELGRACHDLAGLANVRCALGEFDAARECLDQVARLAPRISVDSTLYFNVLGARAMLAIATGDGLDALVTAGEAMLERAASDHAYAQATTRAALARAYAEVARRDAALGAVREVRPALERAPGWASLYVITLHMAVEAIWLLGAAESCDALERSLREKVLAPDLRGLNADARLSLARLCALQGRFEEASDWFGRARQELDEQGARPLRAIADHDQALMLVRLGDRGRAEPFLERAVTQFREIGMPGWVRRARALFAPT